MSARRPTTILVADDDPDIRRLVAFTLRRRGHAVVEAATGDDALALARAHRPDLVVLDVMMPGLSGLDVASALASDADLRHTPVVLVSAKGQVSEVAAGLAAGARAYVVKPFAPAELAARCAELLPD
jgi:DNA-binding response OmpR family regulator